MTLREVMRAVIKRVESVSGCPVVVNEDRLLASIKPAFLKSSNQE